MTDGKKTDMDALITVKQAAAEIEVHPKLINHYISLGTLKADKFGGRDWWIRRGDLMAFNAQRKPAGRPRGAILEPTGDPEVDRLREYYRERKRISRDRQKEVQAISAKGKKVRGSKAGNS